MTGCEQLTAGVSDGVAPALRAVDCLASETTAAAFGRIFGGNGVLVPALTILLTLYIAFFAISLLTGRSRLGISALTPRMLTLGLVLTFATSWVAYQGVVWNLAIGAPDQIASVITGANGSATQIFADRIDLIFAAIAEVAQASGGAPSQAASGTFTPGNVMWLGALLLLLGTVGVLVTVRIALAVLLALGPVFVVLALFPGTRGLTAGWLRGVVVTAITPLFVVVGGGIVMELLIPVISELRSAEGTVDGRAAVGLFMIAAVHVALMSLTLKVAVQIVSAWRVFGLAGDTVSAGSTRTSETSSTTTRTAGESQAQSYNVPRLRGGPVMAVPAESAAAPANIVRDHGAARVTGLGQSGAAFHSEGLPAMTSRRARGVGSRFQSNPSPIRKMMR